MRILLAACAAGIVLFGCTTPAPDRTPQPLPAPVPPAPAPAPLPPPAPAPEIRYERQDWATLPGWSTDAVQSAWPAFLATCRALGSRETWRDVCAAARATKSPDAQAVRAFFVRHFEPFAITRAVGPLIESSGLVTGYYEPLLHGSRAPSLRYNTPLYARPADLLIVDLGDLYPELAGKRVRGRLEGNKVVPYYSRAEMGAAAKLEGSEIVWVDSPLDAFLLQVQGSGRVQLADGETIRLQYADQNGHPYRSIGRYLVDRGELTLEEASMPRIRAWLAANPHRLDEVLHSNPSVVFFREERLTDPSEGPKGALGVPLTPGRSIAVDPAFVPLGAPVFLATTHPGTDAPLQRLVIAQDTGGAIKGPMRADFFWGFGTEAATRAGTMRQQGSMWVLWPKGVPAPWRQFR